MVARYTTVVSEIDVSDGEGEKKTRAHRKFPVESKWRGDYGVFTLPTETRRQIARSPSGAYVKSSFVASPDMEQKRASVGSELEGGWASTADG